MNNKQMALTLLRRGEEYLNMFFSAWDSRNDLPNLNPVIYTSMVSTVLNYGIILDFLESYVDDKHRLLVFQERVDRAAKIDRTLYNRQYYACRTPSIQKLGLL